MVTPFKNQGFYIGEYRSKTLLSASFIAWTLSRVFPQNFLTQLHLSGIHDILISV